MRSPPGSGRFFARRAVTVGMVVTLGVACGLSQNGLGPIPMVDGGFPSNGSSSSIVDGTVSLADSSQPVGDANQGSGDATQPTGDATQLAGDAPRGDVAADTTQLDNDASDASDASDGSLSDATDATQPGSDGAPQDATDDACDANLAPYATADAASGDAGVCLDCLLTTCSTDVTRCESDCPCSAAAITIFTCVQSGTDPTTCFQPANSGGAPLRLLGSCAQVGCAMQCGTTLFSGG